MIKLPGEPNKNPRKPSDKLQVAAVTGAVVIATPDGYSIVVTPRIALELGKQLPGLAHLAGGMASTSPRPIVPN